MLFFCDLQINSIETRQTSAILQQVRLPRTRESYIGFTASLTLSKTTPVQKTREASPSQSVITSKEVSEKMITSDVSVQSPVLSGLKVDKDEREYMEEELEPKPKKIKLDEMYSKKLLYIELAKLGSVIEKEKTVIVRNEEVGQKELQELIECEKLARTEVVKNQAEDYSLLEEKQKTEIKEVIQRVLADQKIEREKLKERQKKDLDEREKVFKSKRTNIATRTLPLREKLEAREKTLKKVESRLFAILQNEKVICDLKCNGCDKSYQDKKIYICLEGLHNICSNCKPRFKTCRECPSDEAGYLARNRSLEEQIKLMDVKQEEN